MVKMNKKTCYIGKYYLYFRQHQSNYQMSQDEILQDIISYCPSVADIDKDTNPIHYQAEIGKIF